MAWEIRGNNTYYYRKKRMAGKVMSQYVGRGSIAQEIALRDLAARKERYSKVMNIRKQIEEFGLFDRQVNQVGLLVNQAVAGFLLISGFHKHKGQWRRRRDAYN